MIATALEWFSTNWYQGLAVFIGGCALVVAIQNVRQSRRTSVANIINSFLSEHASDRMQANIAVVAKMADEDEVGLLSGFCNELSSPSAPDGHVLVLARKVNGNVNEVQVAACRAISNFYERAYKLYQHNFITAQGLRVIVGDASITFLPKTVGPLIAAVTMARESNSNPSVCRKIGLAQNQWLTDLDIVVFRVSFSKPRLCWIEIRSRISTLQTKFRRYFTRP